jgi:hypothetical protein
MAAAARSRPPWPRMLAGLARLLLGSAAELVRSVLRPQKVLLVFPGPHQRGPRPIRRAAIGAGRMMRTILLIGLLAAQQILLVRARPDSSSSQPWLDQRLPPSQRASLLVAQMNLTEQIANAARQRQAFVRWDARVHRLRGGQRAFGDPASADERRPTGFQSRRR